MTDSDLYGLLKEIKPVSIVLVGDVILDHYLGGEVTRVSPEAPVGIVDCKFDEYKLGGAANVAANLGKLGCGVVLLGVTGKDSDAGILKALLKNESISANTLTPCGDRPTTKKTRVMAQGQQLLRIDREERKPIPKKIEQKLIAHFKKALKGADGVIVSDYNKGLLTNSFLKNIISLCRKNKKRLVVDPKGDSFAKYRGADVITPNRRELERATGIQCGDYKMVKKAALALIRKHSFKSVLATLGPDGMGLFEKKGAGRFFPTAAQEVFDVSGAGDTVVAVFTAALLGGLLPEEAARLSNYAGALQVAHLGAVGVGIAEIESGLAKEAGHTESKIIGIEEAAEISEALRKRKKKVVFTNGCFDLLHYGHIKYLQKARKLGHSLMVGLNSDSSVRKLKGRGRPLIGEDDRAHILAALDCVDHVIIFGEPTPIKLINKIKPGVLVKGGDYKIDQIVGHTEVKKWGGSVKTINYIKGSSTTGLIQKIIRTRRG